MGNESQDNADATAAVLSVMAGEASVEQAAAKYGLPPAALESMRGLYVAGLRAGNARQLERSVRVRRSARAAALGAAGLLVAAVAFWSASAVSQANPCGVAGQLFTFMSGQPARACQINHNFDHLSSWLEDKVGPFNAVGIRSHGAVLGEVNSGGTDLTVLGDAQVDGALTAPTINSSGATVTIADTLSVTGAIRATGEITATGAVSGPGTVVAGAYMQCNGPSNALNVCTNWGGAGCVGCGGTCPADTTMRPSGGLNCWCNNGSLACTCYHFVCVRN